MKLVQVSSCDLSIEYCSCDRNSCLITIPKEPKWFLNVAVILCGLQSTWSTKYNLTVRHFDNWPSSGTSYFTLYKEHLDKMSVKRIKDHSYIYTAANWVSTHM